jgi:hypothetical protein
MRKTMLDVLALATVAGVLSIVDRTYSGADRGDSRCSAQHAARRTL